MWYDLHSPFFLLHVVAFALALACGIYLLINSNFISTSIASADKIFEHEKDNAFAVAPNQFPEETVNKLRRIRDYMCVIGIGALVVACLSFANLYTFLALILGAESRPAKYMPGMRKSRKTLAKEIVAMESKRRRR